MNYYVFINLNEPTERTCEIGFLLNITLGTVYHTLSTFRKFSLYKLPQKVVYEVI